MEVIHIPRFLEKYQTLNTHSIQVDTDPAVASPDPDEGESKGSVDLESSTEIDSQGLSANAQGSEPMKKDLQQSMHSSK